MRIGLLIILFFIPPLLISAQPEKYTRIEIPCSLENIEEVYRLGINIAFIEPDDYLWLEVSEVEFALLKTTVIDYRILIEDISEFYRSRNSNKDYKALFEAQKQSGRYSVPSGFTFGSMGGFSTYLEILGHLDNMFELYPGLITQPQPISEDTTTEGRHLYWQRISNNPTVTQEKPRVLYTALTHAREPASVQQLLYFMYYILENYGVDDEITDIVDNTELYFVPCVNPDGYVYNQMESPQGGGMWRKNRRNNGDGSFGVDLNRNFGYKWGYDGMGSSPIPSSNTFRGNAPFSEPETKLIKNLCEEYSFSVVLNYHSYGSVLLHPWGYVSYLLTPDHNLFQKQSRILTRKNNYSFNVPGALLYIVNGDACDWMYGEKQAFAFLAEVGTNLDGFWPPVERIIPLCEENLYQNIMTARLAGFYADFKDLSPINLTSQEGWLKYSVMRIGISDKPFSIDFLPLDNSFLQLTNNKNYSTSALNSMVTDSIYYILKPGLKTGDEIKFIVDINAEGFHFTDTISKIYGLSETIFFDSCSDLSAWTVSAKWNITSHRYKSPEFSIGNAPSGVYSNNETTHITLSQPIDLTNINCAWLSYYVSWDLDGGKDWVKLMASTDDGQTWEPLQARFMDNEFIISEPETFVYQGKHDDWVKDWVSLKQFCGKQLLLGFWFGSDAATGRLGLFFDDFEVSKLIELPAYASFTLSNGWNAISGFLHPDAESLDEIFSDYAGNILILTNLKGIYQPGSQNNTISNWDVTTGYFLKASEGFNLNISGSKPITSILELKGGWNLIPVMSESPVPINLLKTIPAENIEMIRDALGFDIYWPDQSIFSLDSLLPGKSYLIKLTQPALLFIQKE